MKKLYAHVVVPKPLSEPLTYSIPIEFSENVLVGSHVVVPFRKSEIDGFVVEISDSLPEALKSVEIKPIKKVLFSNAVFNKKDLHFFQWISNYYQLPLGEVFYSAYPKSVFKELKRKTRKSDIKQNTEKPVELNLTSEQSQALSKIESKIQNNNYHSFLLFGVTGSGKTEIYLRAAKAALNLNKTTLILVPEISLTPQLRGRLESHFQDQVAVLHSGITEKERREFWWDILNQNKKIVVGARSALFAPLNNIGLIIVDEEHDPSYKQEDRLRYNARDLALVRGKQHNSVVILGSATPSIETFHATKSGKHELIQLTKRATEQSMPKIEIIDMKKEPKPKGKGNISEFIFSAPLKNAIEETVRKNEQCMLFINRKGFSNFLLCTGCGDVPTCLNCSVSLTYYQKSNVLKCHYCGFQIPKPESCTKCSGELKPMGIGTELVENELHKLFPNFRVARLDTDIVSNSKDIEKILTQFRNKEIDILVGTQMIAKGHDFPDVTLIGIILADLNLHLPDFRASERSFQLLSQVAGRAGRAQKAGYVYLQTFLPEHYVIQTAKDHDYERFYEIEIDFRKSFSYPPFCRIAQLEFRHLKDANAKKEAQHFANLLSSLLSKSNLELSFFGPNPATISKIANKYRWQIILKSEKISDLNSTIKTLRSQGARFIDVDPLSTL